MQDQQSQLILPTLSIPTENNEEQLYQLASPIISQKPHEKSPLLASDFEIFSLKNKKFQISNSKSERKISKYNNSQSSNLKRTTSDIGKEVTANVDEVHLEEQEEEGVEENLDCDKEFSRKADKERENKQRTHLYVRNHSVPEKHHNVYRHSWYAPIHGALNTESDYNLKEISSLHNLAGVKNNLLNGTYESASLLEPQSNHHSSRVPRTNTVCIVPSGQYEAPQSQQVSASAPVPRKRKFEQFIKNLVGRRPSKEPASSPLISSPEIKANKSPSEHNLTRLSRTKLNTSTTSLNSVHQKLWSMVPLLRKNGSCGSLHAPKSQNTFAGIGHMGLRKCETVLALTNSNGVEPIKPLNRLRNCASIATCSRCSSLLSLAAGSKYSLNLAGGGFVSINNCSNVTTHQQQKIINSVVPELSPFTPDTQSQSLPSKFICKLCLGEYKIENMTKIDQCGCSFCTECMTAYIEFEITEGAYEVSCPDAMCPAQGVISISEIATLADPSLVDKHHRYRLNREVELDKNRTWCPKAGCETICLVGSSSIERLVSVQPTSSKAVPLPCAVHCPTCLEDFCSGCKKPWHPTMTCEENTKQQAATGKYESLGIPFDNDLIKCCPMCFVPIEKDEGCAQMMCKRCKHVFCWYCLASLDDDFLLRHYDKGPCKNKLGHSRASVVWHRAQVIGIFAGFGILLLVASPLLLLAAPCIVCCKCRICSGAAKLEEHETDIEDGIGMQR